MTTATRAVVVAFVAMLRILCVLALACLACGDEPPPKSAPQSLVADAPIPPGAGRIQSSGGSEAVEAVYLTGLPADSVASWYRWWFLEHSWRIAGDTKLPDGTFVIHAENQATPLWIMIRPERGRTTFSVMSAVPGGQ